MVVMVSTSFSILVSGHITSVITFIVKFWRAARSLLYWPVSHVFERSLTWLTVDDLEGIEPAVLYSATRVPAPSADAPLLFHEPSADKEYLELPPPRTALLSRPIYSSKYQIVLLSRHRVLADTINDRYPFRIGLLNVYGRRIHGISGYATSFRARWSNYYHLLIDVLPRLELFRHAHFERYDEISLICPGGLLPLEQILLDKMGLPPRTKILPVEVDQLYRPEHYVHVTFPTLPYCGAVPGWYRERVRERLLPKRPGRRAHRILVSRQHASKRRILNFADLEAALRPMGFEVVELEALDFENQVELFYDAEIVVGPHGAGLTNVLFADRVDVIELFPSWYVMPHYLYLARSLGHSYQYCVADMLPEGADRLSARETVLTDLLHYNDSHFTVDVAAVVERLRVLNVS